ncbi:VOC family protein [Paenalcaligenes niemegkensis]|uniref:VOC family protein n=1 Tax=Paenalcaligenes niemegkensis TaxID=2895469 RepID=UPI001EE8798D|nr:VOC family protein [Paenalcaligenes niemegkensis]MCQ9618007.1 VOC family protein [Paenalcaligenes niemegkensis]
MQVYPYLIFNGNTAEAMTFYQQVLGGELNMSRFSEMPDFEQHFNAEVADRIMNAQLKFDDGLFMASDGCPDQPTGPIDGFAVALAFNDTTRAAYVFDALAADGTTIMPWEPTFWADAFGMVKDKYGVTWMVNSGIKNHG